MSEGNDTQQQTQISNQEFAELVANLLSMRSELFGKLTDPRRDLNKECGYPETSTLTAQGLRDLYDSDSIAARAVEVLPKESWQVSPKLIEKGDPDKPTEFEQAWKELPQTLNDGRSWLEDDEGNVLWEYLLRADILSGIGQFGIILLGINDGQNLMVPVQGSVVANTTAQYGDSHLLESEEEALRALPKLTKNEERWIDRLAAERDRVKSEVAANAEKLTTNADLRERMRAGDDDAVLDAVAIVNNAIAKRGNAKLRTGKTKKADTRQPQDSGDLVPKASMGGVGNDPKVDMGMQLDGATDQYYGNDPGIGLPTGPVDLGYGPGGMGTDVQYFSSIVSGPSQKLADQPLKSGLKLLFLRVYDESLVQVVRYEWSARNPRFGQPVMYRVTLNDPKDQHGGVGLPLATVFVHWSRVVHIADNRHVSEVFGYQRLRQIIKPVLDQQKVRGAGAEGYWQSCFTGLSFETQPSLGGDVAVNKADMRAQIDSFKNHLSRVFLLMGMTAKTIAPSVVDPTPHINVAIEAICILLGIPVRVFKGSERGELASSQDDESFNDRLRHRQQFYITPKLIAPFVDRLILLGILPEPEQYKVEWPSLDALGESDRAGILQQICAALAQYVSGDVESVMPIATLLGRVLKWDHQEVTQVLEDVHQAMEDRQNDAKALADEHGFEPEPPEGFQTPEPEEPKKPFGGVKQQER